MSRPGDFVMTITRVCNGWHVKEELVNLGGGCTFGRPYEFVYAKWDEVLAHMERLGWTKEKGDEVT